MIAVKTWILIANGTHARVLLHGGIGHKLVEVPGMKISRPHLSAKEIMADKPGRTFDSKGSGRHAKEYHSSPEREQSKKMANELAVRLETKLRRGEYDRLILVAAPELLGHLRDAFPKSLTKVLHAELTKDLTQIADDKIAKHLSDVIAI